LRQKPNSHLLGGREGTGEIAVAEAGLDDVFIDDIIFRSGGVAFPRRPGLEPGPQPLAQYRPLGRINSMQLKNMLRRIHSDADNLFHGRLPCLRFATTSFWHTDAVGGRPLHQLPAADVKQDGCHIT
jgi:hypothetical protein